MSALSSLPSSLCLVLLIHCMRVTSQEPRTYAQLESYAEYPQWLTTSEGLAQFSFRASRADGLLLYLDSNNSNGHYLAVWLQGGRLKARVEVGGAEALETTFGEHLNDLDLHVVRIVHNDQEFKFYVNNTFRDRLTYATHLVFTTKSRVFLGGMRNTYLPDYAGAAEMGPLAGCVEEVKFADNSIHNLRLETKEPLLEHQLLSGCVDECAPVGGGAQCNGGRCVTSWSSPDRYFCDCSGAGGVGEFCTEASSSHQLTLTGEAYYCYSLTHQPFTNHHDDIVVQLEAPLPSSGTILTGHSDNWTTQFSLYLEGNRLHYELKNDSGSEYAARSNITLSQNQNYRISVTRSEDRSEITIAIQTVSANNEIANADSIILELSSDNVPPVFPSICVGGGALEVVRYIGIMERVFVGHLALAEQRNSSYFTREQVQGLDTISVSGEPSNPALIFRKHRLNSDRISFQFRIEREHGVGILLTSRNGNNFFTISIFKSEISDIIMFAGLPSSYKPCNNIFVVDNQWHLFELKRFHNATYGGPGIILTVDNDDANSCHFSDATFGEILDTLAVNSDLQIAPTTSSNVEQGNPVPFIGCFQDFEFTLGSDVFHPNLEAAVEQYARFSRGGCWNCIAEEGEGEGEGEVYCLNGGMCQDEGAFQEKSCLCSPHFTGSRCKDLAVTGTPIITAFTPSPPSSTTPSTSTEPPIVTVTDGNTGDPSNKVDYDALGQWVGIATAIILVLILLLILLIFIGCFVHSQRIRRIGFYRTHENTASVSLPHFSASLKTAHSHTLNLEQNRVTAITNGRTVHPTYASGEKEFYI